MEKTIKNKYIQKITDYFPEIKFKNAKLIEKGWDHDVIILDNGLEESSDSSALLVIMMPRNIIMVYPFIRSPLGYIRPTQFSNFDFIKMAFHHIMKI